MSDAPEIWKEIPGYEGRYSVSDLGRVYSHLSGRCLKPWRTCSGKSYLAVTLCVGNVRKAPLLHFLILLTFAGPRPDGAECLHGSEGKFCNALRNLRYGTKQENESDKHADGAFLNGSRVGGSVLKEDDIHRIREDRRPLKAIAADYGVHFATISAVKTRKNWRHV